MQGFKKSVSYRLPDKVVLKEAPLLKIRFSNLNVLLCAITSEFYVLVTVIVDFWCIGCRITEIHYLFWPI